MFQVSLIQGIILMMFNGNGIVSGEEIERLTGVGIYPNILQDHLSYIFRSGRFKTGSSRTLQSSIVQR